MPVVVCNAQGIVFVFSPNDGGHGSKKLLHVGPHARLHATKDRWLVEIAGFRHRFTAKMSYRSLPERIHHLAVQRVAQIGPRQWPYIRFFIGRISHLQCGHVLGERRQKLVGDSFDQNEALGRDAALPGVQAARGDPGRCRLGDIRVFQDDEGIRAPQLQHGFLQMRARHLSHLAPGRFATCERDGMDAWVRDYFGYLPAFNEQCAEHAVRQPGLAKAVFDCECALRRIGGVFEHRRIAGHEGRRGETKHLPEGKIPGHDGQDSAERQVGNQAAARVRADFFVGKIDPRIFSVILTSPGAFLDLCPRLPDHFSHFGCDEPGIVFRIRPKDSGSRPQDARPLGEPDRLPARCSQSHLVQHSINLSAIPGGERLQDDAGGRINALQCHSSVGPFVQSAKLSIVSAASAMTLRFANRSILSLFLLLVVWALPAQSRPKYADEQRENYFAALDALKARDTKRFQQILERQKDYVLRPYLEYEYLKDRLDTSPAAVERFLEENEDTPLADMLRRKWLRLLAERGDWARFTGAYRAFDDDIELRCIRLGHALRASEDKTAAMAAVGRLWLNGSRLPAACEDLFGDWRKAGYLTNEAAWARIRLAMEKRNLTLASQLGAFVEEKVWVDRWIAMHKDPARELRRDYPTEQPLAREVLRHGVIRLANNDPVVAYNEWRRLRSLGGFTDEDERYVMRNIGVLAAQDHLPQAVKWLGELDASASDENVRQWRVRAAIRAGAWDAVQRFSSQMPEREQQDSAWRYWKARALEKLGLEAKAQELFSSLAVERSYYGFLAADRLGLPYYMQHVSLDATKDEVSAMLARRGIQMAQELHALGDITSARRQWEYTTRRMSNRELQVAAVVAASWGWHDRAILTVAKTDHLDDLELRFPVLYREMVEVNANENKLDPGWVYGVMRQESAFTPDARSQAGALGLMQLMPQTGRLTGRALKLRIKSDDMILRVENNLRLGTHYLRTVLDQTRGHQAVATASYNAGPNRAREWLPAQDGVDADVWVETIPFNETRNYVKNVMGFTTIYDHRLGLTSNRLQSRLPPVPPRS